jgi:glycerol-3-phosphate dehydrogenase (NAD(P)+)
MKKIAILEPGAWGTTLGILLNPKNEVRFWYENPELSLKISRLRENERLSGVKIPKKIFISSNLREVIEEASLIIISTPIFSFRRILVALKNFQNLPPLLGIAKGIEKETLKLSSEIVQEILGKIPYAHLSGPGFAREVVGGKPTKEVIASRDQSLTRELEELFKVRGLEVSTTNDLIGIQLTGALKNALAIGLSLVEAKNPPNSKIKESLTRLSLEEMIIIGKAMGAKRETFLGPAGWGDLILTSTNPLSRNWQFGQILLSGAQKMRKEIKERKLTVEGFDNVWAFYKLGKIYRLDLPIINEIYKVIYRENSPEKAIRNLIKLTS